MVRGFVTISNEEIFRKIEGIECKLDKDIAARLAKLDKRVTVAVWVSSTALTLCLLIIGVILKAI